MKKYIYITLLFGASGLLTFNFAFAQNNDNRTNAQSAETTSANFFQKAQENVNDSLLTARVKAKFLRSAMLKGANISVKTKEKTVYLSGLLESDSQYEEAIILAENINGVKDVDAKGLEVKNSRRPMQDLFLTAKIKTALLKEKIFGQNISYWPVEIESNNGTVYLRGTVDSQQEKQTIENIVKSVSGVETVKNALQVRTKSDQAT